MEDSVAAGDDGRTARSRSTVRLTPSVGTSKEDESMAKRIKCPACGARGEIGDDITFEIRGRFQGRAVQRCLSCGSGIFVKPPLGRVEVIPHDLWTQMQERWDEEFGSDDDNYPSISQAVEELFDQAPDDLSPHLLVLSSAAQDVAGAALRHVANEEPESWAALDVDTIQAVIRCAAAYFVLAASHDATLRAHFAEWLDLRPSDVPGSVLGAYTEAFLTAEEGRLVGKMKAKWDDEDPQGYAMAIGRMMWEAAGQDGTPPITDVMQWQSALHGLREPFGHHFMSELERFAQG